MMLLALSLAAAEPLVPTERAFHPPAGLIRYRVTQVRRAGAARLRAALTETLRIEPDEGGFRAILLSGDPAVEGPPALTTPLKLALGTFARIAVTYQLDRSGHPVSVIDADVVWTAMLDALDTQLAAAQRSPASRGPALAAVRAALAAKPAAAREAMLLDMADTLLGFVPDALAVGQTLPYTSEAVGAGTIRRAADEEGVARYEIETAGGRPPAREHVEVAVDPDGLLRWLRRTVSTTSSDEPDQAMLIERLQQTGN